MLRKFFLGVFLVSLIVLVGAGCQTNPTRGNGKILFYRNDCPHCKNVEAYVNENNVKSRISYEELEVSSDQVNVKLMLEKAKVCNLDVSQGVGVPFFWDGTKCIVGDTPIIDYLKEEIKK